MVGTGGLEPPTPLRVNHFKAFWTSPGNSSIPLFVNHLALLFDIQNDRFFHTELTPRGLPLPRSLRHTVGRAARLAAAFVLSVRTSG